MSETNNFSQELNLVFEELSSQHWREVSPNYKRSWGSTDVWAEGILFGFDDVTQQPPFHFDESLMRYKCEIPTYSRYQSKSSSLLILLEDFYIQVNKIIKC